MSYGHTTDIIRGEGRIHLRRLIRAISMESTKTKTNVLLRKNEYQRFLGCPGRLRVLIRTDSPGLILKDQGKYVQENRVQGKGQGQGHTAHANSVRLLLYHGSVKESLHSLLF
jgi:predicted nucleic acid-binding Zn ribbon protein